jgi:hypothetical protein
MNDEWLMMNNEQGSMINDQWTMMMNNELGSMINEWWAMNNKWWTRNKD